MVTRALTIVLAFRLNYCAMSYFIQVRRVLWVCSAVMVLAAVPTTAQEKKQPLTVKPDSAGLAKNHRLILKDGTYQIVRQYQIVGDRVRYMSLERGGDWEELPANLVDWDATRKWEQHHSAEDEAASPAMKEAEEVDKEEAAERLDERQRRPEVVKGLELPDEDGVFALDIFQGTPELIELVPSDVGINTKTKKGVSTFNPLAGSNANIELPGQKAKVHLHVNDPSIYLSLQSKDEAEKVLSHALTVPTGGAKEQTNRKHGAHSATSGFALVRVDQRKEVRIVGAIHLSPTGAISQNEDIVATKVELLPGKHWLKLTPQQPLTIGEYALIEIISASEVNQSVWDFRVDPRLGDNPYSLTPILSQ
jgi:hypothetical protein